MSNLVNWGMAALVLGVGALVLASLAADMVGLLGSGIQEWLKRRYGFPRNVRTGAEGLVGRQAVVSSRFESGSDGRLHGWVFLHGERWRASMNQDIEGSMEPESRVCVTKVRGLILEVSPIVNSAESGA